MYNADEADLIDLARNGHKFRDDIKQELEDTEKELTVELHKAILGRNGKYDDHKIVDGHKNGSDNRLKISLTEIGYVDDDDVDNEDGSNVWRKIEIDTRKEHDTKRHRHRKKDPSSSSSSSSYSSELLDEDSEGVEDSEDTENRNHEVQAKKVHLEEKEEDGHDDDDSRDFKQYHFDKIPNVEKTESELNLASLKGPDVRELEEERVEYGDSEDYYLNGQGGYGYDMQEYASVGSKLPGGLEAHAVIQEDEEENYEDSHMRRDYHNVRGHPANGSRDSHDQTSEEIITDHDQELKERQNVDKIGKDHNGKRKHKSKKRRHRPKGSRKHHEENIKTKHGDKEDAKNHDVLPTDYDTDVKDDSPPKRRHHHSKPQSKTKSSKSSHSHKTKRHNDKGGTHHKDRDTSDNGKKIKKETKRNPHKTTNNAEGHGNGKSKNDDTDDYFGETLPRSAHKIQNGTSRTDANSKGNETSKINKPEAKIKTTRDRSGRRFEEPSWGYYDDDPNGELTF